MRYPLAILLRLLALGGAQARALPGVSNALGASVPALDFTHISDYPLDDPLNTGLAKRVAAGVSPPPRPPPTTHPTNNNGKPGSRPRLGRPNANEEPESAAMAIERTSLLDTSDIIKVSPCSAAKRDLDPLEFSQVVHKRMSGQDKALTWEEWQQGKGAPVAGMSTC
jgi:hypothetical protein